MSVLSPRGGFGPRWLGGPDSRLATYLIGCTLAFGVGFVSVLRLTMPGAPGPVLVAPPAATPAGPPSPSVVPPPAAEMSAESSQQTETIVSPPTRTARRAALRAIDRARGYFDKGWYRDVFRELDRALGFDPSLRTDAAVIDLLVRLLARDRTTAQAVVRLRQVGRDALPYLAVATRSDDPEQAAGARALLEELGGEPPGEELVRLLQQHAEQGASCLGRRLATVALSRRPEKEVPATIQTIGDNAREECALRALAKRLLAEGK